METASVVALGASGGFLLVGLLTGVWKYWQMWASEDAQAHYYVNTAHRASLLYSFAALVLYQFVQVTPLSPRLAVGAVLAPIAFFAFAVGTYVVHGWLQDTDNQFREPHVLGSFEVPRPLFHGAMWALVVAEVGGVAVLFGAFVLRVAL